jgi:hypothetical protein
MVPVDLGIFRYGNYNVGQLNPQRLSLLFEGSLVSVVFSRGFDK